jgi:RNA polymerase sigma-70 factor (ECF subfamily)
MQTPDYRHRDESSPDDATVIARVLDGDKQQFAKLVARYQAALYRHAVSIVLDYDVAADMVQDALVRAYTHLATCRDHARFRAWLFQMLRNRCLDHLKEARQRDVPLDDAGPIVDGAEGPGALVERARLRTQITRALAMLPEAQREAFLMHYVEGISYDAMADLLDASVSALKMRVLRAREALASALRNCRVTETPPARLVIRGS